MRASQLGLTNYCNEKVGPEMRVQNPEVQILWANGDFARRKVAVVPIPLCRWPGAGVRSERLARL